MSVARHAVLHLLYTILAQGSFRSGISLTPEPFQRLVNQGIILGPDNEDVEESRQCCQPGERDFRYGADSLRLYEMFMGPLEQMKP
jgi:leucyl-tRNA synthetase